MKTVFGTIPLVVKKTLEMKNTTTQKVNVRCEVSSRTHTLYHAPPEFCRTLADFEPKTRTLNTLYLKFFKKFFQKIDFCTFCALLSVFEFGAPNSRIF